MAPVLRDRHMNVRRQAHMIKDVTQVAAASKLGNFEILDARSPGRFAGREAEPREGLRAGHIPGSKNLYYRDLLAADGTMLDLEGLRAAFEASGADLTKPIITTCGSGVTACILCLALERLGHDRHSVYDGSWSEWGMYNDLNVETGD